MGPTIMMRGDKMLIECIVRKGTADETDFNEYISQSVEVSKVVFGQGPVFIKNVSYDDFKSYIDGAVYTWSMVNYINYNTHYELWLEVS